MTSFKTHIILLSVYLVVLPFWALAGEFPERPSPPRLVNDFENTMTPSEQAALERKLVNYNDSTSTQIAIVTLKSIRDYDISDYSFRLAEKWGIGQRGKDNGILILAVMDDRAVFIATGYGMEDVVPDALANRIVDDYLVPNFKKKNFYKGFDEATDVIIGLASGKYNADDLYKRRKRGVNIFTILFILFMIILMSIFRRRREYYTYTGRGMNRGGGFWGGGSFGGGGGGGGFGGFGGGSFGGGGAGGRW